MKLIRNETYNKIPLFDRLDKMSMKQLIKYAWENYGITYVPSIGLNKYDLISEIGSAIARDKPKVKLKYK